MRNARVEHCRDFGDSSMASTFRARRIVSPIHSNRLRVWIAARICVEPVRCCPRAVAAGTGSNVWECSDMATSMREHRTIVPLCAYPANSPADRGSLLIPGIRQQDLDNGVHLGQHAIRVHRWPWRDCRSQWTTARTAAGSGRHFSSAW
jgi:hypothetical protein